jgi:hypothetical protein
MVEHLRKPRGGKDAAKERDGLVIRQRQPFIDMDLCACIQSERYLFGTIRFQQKDPFRRCPSGSGDVLVEPHPRADGIVGGGCHHKKPCTASGINKPFPGQGRQGMAHGMTVDAKTGCKLGLGRNFVPFA